MVSTLHRCVSGLHIKVLRLTYGPLAYPYSTSSLGEHLLLVILNSKKIFLIRSETPPCISKFLLHYINDVNVIARNLKDIAKLRGSEDLWEVAKLHNRESSFPMVVLSQSQT